MTVFEAARQTDCVQAAERLGLRIKRSGGKAFACCLFHTERTPSMCLYPGDGGFYCFGCHEHGNAIRLYQQALNCTPLEAARRICEDFGLPYEDRPRKRVPPLPQPVRRVDAWALAKKLVALREQRADVLLARMRSAEAAMERVEASQNDPEAVLNDSDWQRAMRIKSTAQEQLAMLDGMTLMELLEYTKHEMEEGNAGRRNTRTGNAVGG